MLRPAVLISTAAILLLAATTRAEDGETIYPRGYDAFQASRDTQVYWETRRHDAINRQLGYNSFFREQAALASTYYYQPYGPLDVPLALGRIYGYGFYDAVPQPIGRREVQTGPNRWESFPIYPEDVAEPPVTTRPYVDVPRVEPKTAPPASREF